ncbi:hypothetical protein [Streptomyces chrestomyceticus]|uniref:hypothetical protein n=1 Tax=Streptomyces chrestomyceticus TaxID=68185 RepID=UPI001F49EC3F|nr:hypothetical protein [Streptomyces chrestomyceticus]
MSLVVTGVLLGLLLADEDRAAVLEQTAVIWSLPAGLAILSIGPFVLWGPVYRRMRAADWSRLTGLLWGLALWLYAYHLCPVSARAFVRLLRGRTGWAKTRRNAEPVTAGTAVGVTEERPQSRADPVARTIHIPVTAPPAAVHPRRHNALFGAPV